MLIFSFTVKRLWNLLFILLPWTDLQEALMPWISYTIGQAAGGWIIVFTDKTVHKATIWAIYVPHFFTFSFQISLVLHGLLVSTGGPCLQLPNYSLWAQHISLDYLSSVSLFEHPDLSTSAINRTEHFSCLQWGIYAMKN